MMTSQPSHHVQVSYPECDENIHCVDQENTDKSTPMVPEDREEDSTQDVDKDQPWETTLEVILEDQQQDFEIAESINSVDCEDQCGSRARCLTRQWIA